MEKRSLTIPANRAQTLMTNMILKTAEPTTAPRPMSSCESKNISLTKSFIFHETYLFMEIINKYILNRNKNISYSKSFIFHETYS